MIDTDFRYLWDILEKGHGDLDVANDGHHHEQVTKASRDHDYNHDKKKSATRCQNDGGCRELLVSSLFQLENYFCVWYRRGNACGGWQRYLLSIRDRTS